jgi:pimeloyl-ACP methyl ester carboxylesterase
MVSSARGNEHVTRVAKLSAALERVAAGEDRFLQADHFALPPADKLRRRQVHTIAGSGHTVQLDAPGEMAELVAQFVNNGRV